MGGTGTAGGSPSNPNYRLPAIITTGLSAVQHLQSEPDVEGEGPWLPHEAQRELARELLPHPVADESVWFATAALRPEP
jgi:hypothetical protein